MFTFGFPFSCWNFVKHQNMLDFFFFLPSFFFSPLVFLILTKQKHLEREHLFSVKVKPCAMLSTRGIRKYVTPFGKAQNPFSPEIKAFRVFN